MNYKNILIEKVKNNAFEKVIELISLETKDKEDILSVLLSRINKIKSDEFDGILRGEDSRIEWNKIRRSLLDIIQELDITAKPENHEDYREEPNTDRDGKWESLNFHSTQKNEEIMFNKLHNDLIKVNLDFATKSELKNCYKCICDIENEISNLEQNYHFIPDTIKILINLESQLNTTKIMLRSNGFQNSKIDYKSRELYGKIQSYLKEISEIKRSKKVTEANEYIASFIIPHLEYDLHNYKSELI